MCVGGLCNALGKGGGIFGFCANAEATEGPGDGNAVFIYTLLFAAA